MYEIQNQNNRWTLLFDEETIIPPISVENFVKRVMENHPEVVEIIMAKAITTTSIEALNKLLETIEAYKINSAFSPSN